MQEGITDDALKTHLFTYASRLSNFQQVREEVRSVLITRQALCQGPVPMDIGALGAKGSQLYKGKGRTRTRARTRRKTRTSQTPR